MTRPRPDGAIGLGAELFGTFDADSADGREVVPFLDGKRAVATKAVTGLDGYIVGPALIPGTLKLNPDDPEPIVTVGDVRVFARFP